MASVPEQARTLFPNLSNLTASRLSAIFGASFSLVAYAIMHRLGPIGGQGASGDFISLWVHRSVAMGCLLCSSPKVFEWLSGAFGAARDSEGAFQWDIKRLEALGATLAVEMSIALVSDPYISGLMLVFSAVINGLSVGNAIVVDHKVVSKTKRQSRARRTNPDTLSLSKAA